MKVLCCNIRLPENCTRGDGRPVLAPVLAWAAFVLLIAPLSTCAAELKLPVLWTRDVGTMIESAASVADIDGDGRDEVVVAGREEIVMLESGGEVAWRWHAKGRFMTYPAILQRGRDPSWIYAADTSGTLTCIDATGKRLWQARLKGPATWSAAVVADLQGDGRFEVVQTDDTGSVWAFSADQGKVLWKASVQGSPVSPAIADLDGDAKAEVVVATGAGTISALRSDGSPYWSREIGGPSPSWSTCAPVVFAASDGQARVAVATSDRALLCLAADGDILWQIPLHGPAASSISAGDIDRDGRADLLVATQLGDVYRMDEAGRIVWRTDMEGRSLAAGAIIDINRDGNLEYVLCTQRGRLLVIGQDGDVVFDRQFDTRTLNVTPAFGDIEKDSPGLEMVVTGGESGNVFCLGTKAAPGQPAPWTAYRADARKSGSWLALSQTPAPRMTPQNLAWDQLLTGEPVRFRVDHARGRPTPLTATAVCLRPDHQRRLATARILGPSGMLRMPVGFEVPGTYRFRWSLKDAAGNELAAGSRRVVVRPFANERALAAKAASQLKKTASAVAPTLPRSASALRREAVLLTAECQDAELLQDSVPAHDDRQRDRASRRTAALVARAKRDLLLAKAIGQGADFGPSTSLIAFEGNLWENRLADRQVPARVERSLVVNRRAVLGEHEPVAIALLNVTGDALNVRVHVDVDDHGPRVVAHRSVCVPTSVGTRAWDPLPELDEASLLSIPPLATRELWLDVATAPAAPGNHRISVRLQAIDGAGVIGGAGGPRSVPAPETTVTIHLRLLPLAMAPPGAIRLCTWAAPTDPQVEDLLEHGNNVFPVGHANPTFDDQGRVTNCDYTQLDQVIDRFHGSDVVLLLQGIPKLRSGLGSPSYPTELAGYLSHLTAHLAERGIDRQHFALYPLDEPGGVGWRAVERYVAFGKVVRAADPRVKIYMDGGGELPMFEAMAPYVDIWCPAITMLSEPSSVMKVVRESGKTLWSYDCVYAYARPVGPNIKNINIIGQFRTAALVALHRGATGIGYWCYNIGGDPWTRIKDEFPLVYPGRTRPVTSRRWEAVREGIEDFRILTALRDRARPEAPRPLDPRLQARIRRLLNEGLARLLDRSIAEVNLGLSRATIDATNNARVLNSFRQELLDCAEAVAVQTGQSVAATHE